MAINDETIKKVLMEMQYAEQILLNWNAYWLELLEKAEATDVQKKQIYEFEKKLYAGVISEKEYDEAVLKITDTLSVHWQSITTNKSNRTIQFSKDGNIYLQKQSHGKPSYDAAYNVESDDFEITIHLPASIDPNSFSKTKQNTITLKKVGNLVVKTNNDIKIEEEITTGIRTIRIAKKYEKKNVSNASVIFEARLNELNNLLLGAVIINTHKSSGKVNGTYRFDVSQEKGVRANFYSRKGIKIDLTQNPQLMSRALLLTEGNNSKQQSELQVATDFANSTEKAIATSIDKRQIAFDSSDFKMEAISNADSNIMEYLKMIKGEFPLMGLTQRVNDYIASVDIKKIVLEEPPIQHIKKLI